jgi:NAD(P)-dependent dehydrogenase (short-subunit alcohol dehydrogenase family)
MKNLNKQRILITGASRGIGLAIAREMLQQGALLILHYHNTADTVKSLQMEFGKNRVAVVKANLEDAPQTAEMFIEAAACFDGLDSVVINAGIFEACNIDTEWEEWFENWQKTIRVNLDAAGILTRLSLELFQRQKQGRLIYIGSRAAFRGETQEYLAYAASKGGLTSLAKSVARSFGRFNVKSFVIAPGFTKTEMAMEAISKIGEDQVLENLALNELTNPEDIAPLVAFIASGRMDHATGTTIDLNAGSHIR